MQPSALIINICALLTGGGELQKVIIEATLTEDEPTDDNEYEDDDERINPNITECINVWKIKIRVL